MIKDSGNRTEFSTGAVRDIQEGKGRCDLLPLDEVADWLDDEVLHELAVFKRYDDISRLFRVLSLFAWENRYDMILEVSKHYEEGAKKYGEYNWQKGIPISRYIDSAVRHYLKHKARHTDEPHDRAFVWNILSAIWTMENKPEMDDFTEVKENIALKQLQSKEDPFAKFANSICDDKSCKNCGIYP